jgi:hypothetical protein
LISSFQSVILSACFKSMGLRAGPFNAKTL